MCNSNQLSFVSAFVSPRLKKDPFEHLPDELCLKVSSSILLFTYNAYVCRFSGSSMSLVVWQELRACLITGTSW